MSEYNRIGLVAVAPRHLPLFFFYRVNPLKICKIKEDFEVPGPRGDGQRRRLAGGSRVLGGGNVGSDIHVDDAGMLNYDFYEL